MSRTTEKKEGTTRSIGCVIPEELYWQFKQIQAERHETMAQAIENAIRLYLDATK